MIVPFVCFFCILKVSVGQTEADAFLQNLKIYEIVDCEVWPFRHKRDLLDEDAKSYADVEVRFRAYDKNFHLLLFDDGNEIEIESQRFDDRKARFYEGVLNSDPKSTVFGYVFAGTFSGVVKDSGQEYFLEPLPGSTESGRVVVYRSRDVHSLDWKILARKPADSQPWRDKFRTANFSPPNYTVTREGIQMTNESDIFCDIEVVADHELFDFFGNVTVPLAAYLYLHAKYADDLYRRTDFNMDGRPDGIRISVKNLSIYRSSDDPNYPMSDSADLSDFLSRLTLRHQPSKFCLSICVVYRDFNSMILGEAFKAEVSSPNAFGGICDEPIRDGDSSMQFNTGVINIRHANGSPLPLAVTLTAFAHEMGHGFGSDHDPLDDPVCAPGDEHGNYLMFPTAVHVSNYSSLFSPCSRLEIWKTLQVKGGCLEAKNATCGNGIREGSEECDCGPPRTCNFLDSCCTPNCTLRSEATCSPKEGDCCYSNCTIVQDSQEYCHADGLQCVVSFCDGQSGHCPPPKVRPGFVCKHKDFSCPGPGCNNSLCLMHGLLECHCEDDIADECWVCCRKDGDCRPFKDLGLSADDAQRQVLDPGASCFGGKFRCDGFGNCIHPRFSVLPSDPSFTNLSVIVISSFVSSLLIITMCLQFRKGRHEQPLLNS